MSVLGLADQIRCDEGGIGGVVRDNGNFRWPRENVDPDSAEQHAFRFGHELVAWSDDDVRRLAGEQPIGKRRNRLHAAEREHDVGPRDLHRVEHVGMNALATMRGRASHHERDTRCLCRGDRHVGRSDVRVAAGRYVASGHVHGYEALPRGHAGMDFDRELADRFALRLREAAHAFGRKPDVTLHVGRDSSQALLDLLLRDDDRSRPRIELRRVFTHGPLAIALDLREHLLGNPACRAGFALRRLRCPFQVVDGHDHRRERNSYIRTRGRRLIDRGQRASKSSSVYRVPCRHGTGLLLSFTSASNTSCN